MLLKKRTVLSFPIAALVAALMTGPPTIAAVKATTESLARFSRHHHCHFTVEDAYSTGKGTYIGMPPSTVPRDIKTISELVKWLRAKLPACTIWRDKLDGRIIHVAYTKALKWKANPMNQRLTFRGTMSLPQVASRIIHKKFRQTGLYCEGYQRVGCFPDVQGIAIERTYRDTVMDFDVRGMTLRRFLSTGKVYNLKGRYPPPIVWRTDYFLKHGRFTGRVDIYVFAMPLRAAPSAAAKKQAGPSSK